MSVVNIFPKCLVLLSVAMLLNVFPGSAAGLSVSGTKILDANGKAFVMRGVNYPYAWFSTSYPLNEQFEAIASVGANTVRVVMSSGDVSGWRETSGDEVAIIIEQCQAHKLICVLEVHDMTGFGDDNGLGASMDDLIAYWTQADILSALRDKEHFVIVNIANEPFGNNQSKELWASEHEKAIRALRKAGINHMLMIDAASWGQDADLITLKQAAQVARADSQNNTVFSVHMYQVYPDRKSIEAYIQSFLSTNQLPLVIGEFGPEHFGDPVDEYSIMQLSQQYAIGYLAWSWSGNSPSTANLDLVEKFNVLEPSTWGQNLFYGEYGIQKTSEMASVYAPSKVNDDTPTQTTKLSSENRQGGAIDFVFLAGLFVFCVSNFVRLQVNRYLESRPVRENGLFLSCRCHFRPHLLQ